MFITKLGSSILVIITLAQHTRCAKILGVFALPSKSHYILGSSLMRGLAEKGHDVTVISPFGEKNPPKNGTYRDVIIEAFHQKSATEKGLDLFEIPKMNLLTTYIIFMNGIGNTYTEQTLSDPNVQGLLKSDEKFDIVIVEQFVNDAMKAFAYHFKAPLVIFSTWASNSWINVLVANPAPPSYIPEQNIYFDYKNFWHRLKNIMIYVCEELNRNLYFLPAQEKLMKKYFPQAPDLDAIVYNASLVIINSHWSTNKAVPRVPNMIDIGGFHIQPPKRLPNDLQEYLDNSKNGVIYFSMGSTLHSTNFPVETRKALLKVFSKLKYNILWKWEEEILPGQPPNVKLGRWLPQQDILAHPNVKAFVTHGGLLSLLESVYHGIPIVAIPVFGDQVMNAVEATSKGFGRYVLYNELNEERFSEALHDVLDNPKYRENMKRRSSIMHDRQNTPMDDVDYWIQYVIRHEGATHLRVDGLDLAWYQYLSLDVAAFVLATTFITFYLLFVFVKAIFSKLGKKKVKKLKRN